jgi:hypothetical protein
VNSLSFKEEFIMIFCVSFSIIILINGIYDFLIIEVRIKKLITSIGVFMVIFSAGLMPKLFLLPIDQILKPQTTSILGNPILLQYLSFIGGMLCIIAQIPNFTI